MSSLRHRRILTTATVHALLAVGAITMFLPFAWTFITSLKTLHEVSAIPIHILPAEPQWGNYAEAATSVPFLNMFVNTSVTAAARIIGQLLFCSMAGYAFARISFPGRRLLFFTLLLVLMIPGQVFLIPNYRVIDALGLLDSLPALIVPGLFSVLGTFLFRQFFLTVPRELEEAAILDGAGHIRIYWSVMLPLVRPGLVGLSVLVLVWTWNEMLWPLIVNTSPEQQTLAAGLASFQGVYLTNYPVLMAGSVIATLPMIIAFVLLQRQFVDGIALTGMK